MRLYLVTPTKEHKKIVINYKKEFKKNGEASIAGAVNLENSFTYGSWLTFTKNNTKQETVIPGYVLGTTFLALDKEDSSLVGIINIRHSLNKSLREYGGHIGYGIRPTKRNQGYATEMLALALEECRKLPLERVLITCNSENIASARVMEKNGGIFEREAIVHGEAIKRYWITL